MIIFCKEKAELTTLISGVFNSALPVAHKYRNYRAVKVGDISLFSEQ